ncbi:pseudouridine-5'-phosphate glycosidase [Mesorhizobium sp. BR1-1-16]|uniref:pseudouridine-5'-phosphate glycosidase n=1 Tax=Mesorhizobium sp. BR1-1-16 TaxID=2876653 RepID=UPI001CCC79E9|nr:pseudouridine-5'-phosphate glycosidase [Mesorhizobium sp. BR1-1-16]MBZ9937602.1 pseudouridine-5'-phosphate glycosidase [Mesorhizobium sp. BR1-1-16]
MSLSDRIRLSDEVAAARADGRPLVALETTIVTHGMPYPENVGTALAVEEVVRGAGAVPATIAIIDGAIRVGLTAAELEDLAGMKNVMKLSRADLAFALATGRPGATTVAATMISAALAGIRVFATGGIGGVHRGAETSFDVSADLYELAETPVTVVSAGAKALLDIPKTLEVLETLGVPVVTVGQDMLPAFWSRDSGLPSPLRLDDPADIASFLATRTELGLKGGLLVANPVPLADEIPAAEMRAHIEEAIRDAERDGIRAKAVTPYVLGRILTLTGGRSLVTNIALVKNNARLAGEIAVALQAVAG